MPAQTTGGEVAPSTVTETPDVILSTHPTYSEFDASVEGLPVVTSTGTRVTAEQATQLKAAAKANGLTLHSRKAD